MSKKMLGMDKKPHRIRNFVLVAAAVLLVIAVIGSLQQDKESTTAPPTTEGPTTTSTTPSNPQADISPVPEPNTPPAPPTDITPEPQASTVPETVEAPKIVELPEPVETITIPEPTTPPEQETIPEVRQIKASVSFTGTQFVITNYEDHDWVNVRFELNPGLISSGYTLKVRLIEAGTTYTVGAMQFANSKGERFNPYQMKPQKFNIVDFFSIWPQQAGMEGLASFGWQ